MEQFYYNIYVDLCFSSNSLDVELTNIKFNEDMTQVLDFEINSRDITEFRRMLSRMIDAECEERQVTKEQLVQELIKEYGLDAREDILDLAEASDKEIESFIKLDIFINLGKPIVVEYLRS